MMKSVSAWKQELSSGAHAARLAALYCCAPEETPAQAARYEAVLNGLDATFGPHAEAGLYSAPGRTEIGGNHTDHQHGRVLAGSVNIDMIAAAAPNTLNQLRVQSEGYDLCVIGLDDLAARKEEENTTLSLLRGECEAFRQRGAKLAGLDVYISSNVPKGSGVSSSAAFEVLIGVILNDCFMTDKVSPIEIAQIGQWAENVYFGKPCGLMDQMASSVGNIITIDFADPAHPDVEPVAVDFSKAGLALCILDSCADHADLTDEYAAVPAECRAVAAVCGGEVLRDVPFETFLAKLPECRKQCGDRAVLRAFHIYADNDRVAKQVAALREGDFDTFLRLVNESGHSSWEYLQNVIPAGYKEHQEMGVTIAAAKHYLNGKGAVREAIAAGVDCCGENRVQELVKKLDEHAYDGAPVHFIGALQRNKVRQVVGQVDVIESVDRRELLADINAEAAKRGIVQDILLEINAGGEKQKSGFLLKEFPRIVEEMADYPAVRVRGLMTVPPIGRKKGDNCRYFQKIRRIAVDITAQKYDNIFMDFLSMGMTDDFEDAIACGSTMVRIGTAIFGPRNYAPVKSD